MGTALVTGATAGLGAEFATQLAAAGHDLVLVARDTARLEATKKTLEAAREIQVELIPADLTTTAGCDAVAARIADVDRPIDILINNAGIGTYKPFGTATVAAEEQQLDLNVRAVLRLSHAAVNAMTVRGSGQIVNISSVSAFVPRAGNASYAASKAWVTLFSEALSLQLAGSGVTVTAIHPGFTHTEFHERAHADMSHVPDRMWLDAKDVVAEGLADAAAGKPLSTPSRQYKVMVAATRIVPRRVLRHLVSRGKF